MSRRSIDKVPIRQDDERSVREKAAEVHPGTYLTQMGTRAVRLGRRRATPDEARTSHIPDFYDDTVPPDDILNGYWLVVPLNVDVRSFPDDETEEDRSRAAETLLGLIKDTEEKDA